MSKNDLFSIPKFVSGILLGLIGLLSQVILGGIGGAWVFIGVWGGQAKEGLQIVIIGVYLGLFFGAAAIILSAYSFFKARDLTHRLLFLIPAALGFASTIWPLTCIISVHSLHQS